MSGFVNSTGAKSGKIGTTVGTPASDPSELDWWQMTTSAWGSLIPITNWGRVTSSGFVHIGTGMTQSSGVFSFPSTGKWLIDYHWMGWGGYSISRYTNAMISTTTNNTSNWYEIPVSTGGPQSVTADNTEFNNECAMVFHVDDISTHKCRFIQRGDNNNADAGGTRNYGNTAGTDRLVCTAVTFQKMGDI